MNTRNAVIASGLAQEGIELIRNIRDNNMLFALSDLSIDPEVAFRGGGLPQVLNAEGCKIDVGYDYVQDRPSLDCAAGDLNEIFFDAETETFSHDDTETQTIFRRESDIEYRFETINGEINQLSGMDVTSWVWWDGNANHPIAADDCNLAHRCIMVEDYLPKRD